MPELEIPLIKGDIAGSETDYRDALPENMIAVIRPILGASGYMLSHPGLKEYAAGLGIDRGGYWNERQNTHFRVSGGNLITVPDLNNLGEISGNLRVSMAHSFNTQAIVSDGRMWLYTGSALSEVTDSNLGDPIDITWIDGYYFLTDGEFIYHTDLNDETQIDPLKFSTSSFSPDPTVAVDKTSDNQVIVINRYSTEYFINRATDNFAFQRIEGKAVKCGAVGTHAETELEGVFYMIGGGREESVSVHKVGSGAYSSVASREVDKILSEYSEDELMVSLLETRVQDRDRFIVMHLPNHTLLYNLSIAEVLGNEFAWTIIKSSITGENIWRGVNGVYDPRIGKWVYGDKLNSNIGTLETDLATQYGNQVESILYTPLFRLESMSIDSIEVDTLPGGQVDTDNVTCAVSTTYDGRTYTKEWWSLYGEKDTYDTRFKQRRLGYVRDNVGLKLRAVSKERLAFTFLRLEYG